MASILLLDDDKVQRQALRAALKERGHLVENATNGRSAIEIAIRTRPEILLTDWMLSDRPNGIQVTECIRSVIPEMHGFLMTGFPSQDLREQVISAKMLGYFRKPLNLDKLDEAMRKAERVAPRPSNHHIALLEYDRADEIVHASPRARKLLNLPDDLGSERRLTRFFSRRCVSSLDSSQREWVSLSTTAAETEVVEGYKLDCGVGNCFLLLVPESSQREKNDPVLELLMEAMKLSLRSQAFKKPASHVLLIDTDPLQRRLTSSQLESLGVQFHSAESLDVGSALFEADENVGLVLVDFGDSGDGVQQLIDQMLDARPDVRVVGTSTAARKQAFVEMGAHGFLPKPASRKTLEALLQP